jgi:EAL domain-containing protein (putative c-di-GMP-specific phosphodiesterase class I)
LVDESFSFAFQPVVDIATGVAYSHEALVRGLNGESAWSVLSRHVGPDLIAFDGACRARAIEVASRIGLQTSLNINMLPSAVFSAEFGLDSTLAAAERFGFAPERLIVEATEAEAIADARDFARAMNTYRRIGVRLAIDDFGAGHAGLGLLAEFQPDIIKLDMGLIRGIESHGPRQAIARAIIQVCADLGIDVVAEGIETTAEFRWLAGAGVHLFQGYLFAKPGFETVPTVMLPNSRPIQS